MGMVNRKISLLLELEDSMKRKRGRQEIANFMLDSAMTIAGAVMGIFYECSGGGTFRAVSSKGLDQGIEDRVRTVSISGASFIEKLSRDKKRVNSPVEFDRSGTLGGNLDISYFVALPIFKEDSCGGFIFLGFSDRNSMDVQELEFLDVFSRNASIAFARSLA